jgi:hypothetical protein
MEYINYVKAKAKLARGDKSKTPVLSEEDETFLQRITSEEEPPPLPARPNVTQLHVAGETQGRDAQLVLMDGAQNIPLPETPDETTKQLVAEPESDESKDKTKETSRIPYKWSFLRRDSRDMKHRVSSNAVQLFAVILSAIVIRCGQGKYKTNNSRAIESRGNR